MAKFLSQEWLDLQRKLFTENLDLSELGSISIQFLVSGVHGNDVSYFWRIEDGQLGEFALGTIDEPTIKLTSVYADALKVSQGELDPSVAFMQGRMKVGGEINKLMLFLPVTAQPGYSKAQVLLNEQTEY